MTVRRPFALLLLCVLLFSCGGGSKGGGIGGLASDLTTAVADSTGAAVDGSAAAQGSDTSRPALDSNTSRSGTTVDAAGPTIPQDVATVTKDTSVAMNLVGQPPPQAKGLPSFSGVLDHTGAAVKPSDLTGHWTVMWFFPMAGTPG